MRGEIYLDGIVKMLWTSETASEQRGGVYHTTNMDQVRQIQIVSQNTVGDYQSIIIYLSNY